MNPFKESFSTPESFLQTFKDLYPKPYDKNEVDPYTKTRIILAAGAEWEANWFSHQMHRNISNTDLRRDIALTRFLEKQQQQKIVNLKPVDETVLETTISYEQLAVDLTAEMAQKELNPFVKEQLEEEENADKMVSKYKLFGDDPKSLYLLDQELSARVYSAPSLVI